MKKIIILYPDVFKSYSKFSRKVLKILQNIQDFSIVYPSDPNEYISKLFAERFPEVILSENENWIEDEITHGIIFDDGEEYSQELKDLEGMLVNIRVIKIKITRVINIKKETQYKNVKSSPGYEYIGRGSYWGNPYSMYEEGESRDEVIRKYKYDFDFEKSPYKEKSRVYELAGKRLGCFCKPQSCHGDVLADFLNSWDDGK